MDLIDFLIKSPIAPLAVLLVLPFILPPLILFNIVNFILRYFSPENVAGKVVFITGASSGIGEQIAYEYAKRGACLAIAARRRDRLETVANKARELGSPDVMIKVTDISKVEDCKQFIDTAVDHFGKLDHLVNNAGILQVPLFEDVTNFEDVASLMDINFWGSVYCTRFAIAHLRKSKGKIAVVASVAAWNPTPRFSFYGASKGAVISFFETLRTEVGTDIGITIATPGLVDTEMTKSEDMKKGKLDLLPSQTAEECAKAIFSSICRGERFLIDPLIFKIIYIFRWLCPELMDIFTGWVLNTANHKAK